MVPAGIKDFLGELKKIEKPTVAKNEKKKFSNKINKITCKFIYLDLFSIHIICFFFNINNKFYNISYIKKGYDVNHHIL